MSLSIDYCSGPYENITPLSTFLLDFAIHVIDLIHFLFGEVESICAFTRGHHAYGVSLRFLNGAVGALNLSDGRAWDIPSEEVELTVKGGNFMTVHNSSTWRISENRKAVEWREPPTYISQGDSGRETGHLAEIEDFVSALKEKRTITRALDRAAARGELTDLQSGAVGIKNSTAHSIDSLLIARHGRIVCEACYAASGHARRAPCPFRRC
jgi:predicted dehydrogenase